MAASHITVPGIERQALLLIQFSANTPWKTLGDGPSTWVLATMLET